MNPLAVASVLIILHSVDGEQVMLNPDHVVLLHPGNELIAKGVKCVVGLSNGKRLSVVEDCATIRKAMESAR